MLTPLWTLSGIARFVEFVFGHTELVSLVWTPWWHTAVGYASDVSQESPAYCSSPVEICLWSLQWLDCGNCFVSAELLNGSTSKTFVLPRCLLSSLPLTQSCSVSTDQSLCSTFNTSSNSPPSHTTHCLGSPQSLTQSAESIFSDFTWTGNSEQSVVCWSFCRHVLSSGRKPSCGRTSARWSLDVIFARPRWRS